MESRMMKRQIATPWLRAAMWRATLLAAVLAAAPVRAQESVALLTPERVSEVTVTPAVADIGVPRQIRIAGTWPGCPPVNAGINSNAAQSAGSKVVQLVLPLTFAPCAAFLTYSVSFTYTPQARGIDKLLVVGADGDYLAEGLLDTRAPTDDRSAFNITGMWYDPQSNGSGLTFVHSRIADNKVFGT